MECSGGKLGCDGAKKAKVKITIDDKVETLQFEAPVCVKEEKTGEQSSEDSLKCWRFWAKTDGNITNQHYACGREAHYQSDGSLKNSGAWLIVDGVRQIGEKYYYWSRIDEVNSYNERFLQVVTKIDDQGNVSGNCDSCLKLGCQITVTSEGGATYKSKRGIKCASEVSCDDNCPPDHTKCEHPEYPGYCCLPCAPTAAKINNLASTH